MGELFDGLMKSIFIESGLSLARIEYVNEFYEFSTSLYVAHKPNSDYFIYINLPEKALSSVSNDIQIELLSILKNSEGSMELLNGESITISSSFEKNATLIIFVNQENILCENVEKQAIAIEEDPYFFKKQVLVVPPDFLSVITKSFTENNIRGYTTYLRNLISNTQSFHEFMYSKSSSSNNVIEYSFAAKLYEKLPFLALSVERSTPGDLQEGIDNDLSETQLEQCEGFLALDLNDLNDWFDEIVKDESNA